MSEINLVDHSFENNSNELELSIQVGLNGFSFCITTLTDAVIKVFRFYPFDNAVLQEDIINKSSQILRQDDLLQLIYKEVRVIYISRQSTLIPNEFFHTDHLKKYLDFNQPIGELDEIYFNPITSLGSQHVFAIPSYFSNSFVEKYKNIKFYNQGTSLINFAVRSVTDEMALNVFIQLNKEFFDIVVLFGKELIFYNTFLYVGPTDLIYFVLYALKQLKIDPKNAEFFISGEQADQPELMEVLSRFVPDMNKAKAPFSSAISPRLSSIKTHQFISLLNLSQCE